MGIPVRGCQTANPSAGRQSPVPCAASLARSARGAPSRCARRSTRTAAASAPSPKVSRIARPASGPAARRSSPAAIAVCQVPPRRTRTSRRPDSGRVAGRSPAWRAEQARPPGATCAGMLSGSVSRPSGRRTLPARHRTAAGVGEDEGSVARPPHRPVSSRASIAPRPASDGPIASTSGTPRVRRADRDSARARSRRGPGSRGLGTSKRQSCRAPASSRTASPVTCDAGRRRRAPRRPRARRGVACVTDRSGIVAAASSSRVTPRAFPAPRPKRMRRRGRCDRHGSTAGAIDRPGVLPTRSGGHHGGTSAPRRAR